MLKGILSVVGMSSLRGIGGLLGGKSRMGFVPFLPGGVLPVAAYLAWKNRDLIKSFLHMGDARQATAAA